MLIYAMIASLDGYVEDESGRFDWAAPDEEGVVTVRIDAPTWNRLRQPAELLLAHRRRDPPGQQPINVNQVIAQSERMLARVLAPATSLRLELGDIVPAFRSASYPLDAPIARV